MVTSQRFRDQHENHQDCLDKIYAEIQRVISGLPGDTAPEKHDRVKRLIKLGNEKRLKEKKMLGQLKKSRHVPRDE